MKLREFEAYLVDFLINPQVPSWIQDLCRDVDGMCPPETLALLNDINTRFLEKGEQYLEIGTWKGRTALAALLKNDAENMVIDPLTYDDSATVFYENVKRYDPCEERISFYQSTWEHVLEHRKIAPPIGVHFFDGDHGDLATFSAWEAWLPYCSDQCLLIADDFAMVPVQRDIELFVRKYSDNILFTYETRLGMNQLIIGFSR